jgi:hypothetical protein
MTLGIRKLIIIEGVEGSRMTPKHDLSALDDQQKSAAPS